MTDEQQYTLPNFLTFFGLATEQERVMQPRLTSRRSEKLPPAT